MSHSPADNNIPASLIYQPVIGFVEQVAIKSPAPGGGSCAALSGSVGCALLIMVTNFTIDKKDLVARAPRFIELRTTLEPLRHRLLQLIDEDTAAFTRYRVATRLPERDASELQGKATELAAATQATINVPRETMLTCLSALQHAPEIVGEGNPNTASDACSGAELLVSGLWSASYNVLINLPGIAESERTAFITEVHNARQASGNLLARVRALAVEKFGG